MPRKFRPGKGRRAGFSYAELSIRDLLRLSQIKQPDFPVKASGPDRLRTFEDFREAWETNAVYFLDGGFQDPDVAKPYDDYMRFDPGTRPWPFWIFDRGYPTIPSNQLAELQHLRELLPGEFEIAKRKTSVGSGDEVPQ
jgi:hypothetical protein